MALDERPLAEWRVTANPRWFVQWIDLASGSTGDDGPYATLSVRVTAESGDGPPPPVGLEQFDAAPGDASIFAFVNGWSELETESGHRALVALDGYTQHHRSPWISSRSVTSALRRVAA